MNAQSPIGKAEKTVTIHEAKTHLSRLIAQVLAGEEVIIARGKEPVVKLVPVHPVAPKRRTPGRFAHLVPPGKDPLADGFWDPLPPEHLGLGGNEASSG
jgi:prevent-host-death family protein